MAAASSQWGIVFVVVSGGIVAALQVGKVPPVIPDLRADFSLSMIQAGWLASVFNLCGALFGVFTGRVADRLGLVRFAVGALLVLMLGGLIMVLASAPWQLYCGRFMEGIGFVGITVVGPALISRAVTTSDRGFAIGMWGSYMPVGMTMALLIVPVLAAATSWPSTWAMLSAVAILPAIGILLMVRRTHDEQVPAAPSSLAPVLIRPGPWLYGFIFACYTAQWFAVMIWMPTYLVQQAGYSLETAARMSAGVVAVNILGNFLAAAFMRRRVPPWILIVVAQVAMALSSAGLLSGIVAGEGRIAFAFAFSGIGGMLPSAVLGGAPRHAPGIGDMATIAGIVMTGANAGTLLGPPLMAALVAYLQGWEQTYLGLWAIGFAGLAAALSLAGIERRQ